MSSQCTLSEFHHSVHCLNVIYFQVIETTDMLLELKESTTDIINLYLETSHVTLQADIDKGSITLKSCIVVTDTN